MRALAWCSSWCKAGETTPWRAQDADLAAAILREAGEGGTGPAARLWGRTLRVAPADAPYLDRQVSRALIACVRACVGCVVPGLLPAGLSSSGAASFLQVRDEDDGGGGAPDDWGGRPESAAERAARLAAQAMVAAAAWGWAAHAGGGADAHWDAEEEGHAHADEEEHEHEPVPPTRQAQLSYEDL